MEAAREASASCIVSQSRSSCLEIEMAEDVIGLRGILPLRPDEVKCVSQAPGGSLSLGLRSCGRSAGDFLRSIVPLLRSRKLSPIIDSAVRSAYCNPPSPAVQVLRGMSAATAGIGAERRPRRRRGPDSSQPLGLPGTCLPWYTALPCIASRIGGRISQDELSNVINSVRKSTSSTSISSPPRFGDRLSRSTWRRNASAAASLAASALWA